MIIPRFGWTYIIIIFLFFLYLLRENETSEERIT